MGNSTKEPYENKHGSKKLILRDKSKNNTLYLKKKKKSSKQGACKNLCKHIRIEEEVTASMKTNNCKGVQQ